MNIKRDLENEVVPEKIQYTLTITDQTFCLTLEYYKIQ